MERGTAEMNKFIMFLPKQSKIYVAIQCELLILALLFLNGCQVLMRPNKCDYIKGDIRLQGYMSLFGHHTYKYLQIGGYKNISTDFPEIYLLFKNGEKILLPNIDIEWINQKKKESRVTTVDRSDSVSSIEEYGYSMTEYLVNDCCFYFRKGGFVVFESISGLKAIISKEGKRYDLPLNDTQVVELFGKEDILKEYFGL